MDSLRAVLAQYAAASPKMGAQAAQPAAADAVAKTNDLKSSLQAVSRNNRAYFLVCVFMIAILFVAACWISLTHLQDPSFIQGVFAVTGVSFLGLITQMVRLWKTKVLADMTLVLAGNLDPADLRPVVELLLNSLK